MHWNTECLVLKGFCVFNAMFDFPGRGVMEVLFWGLGTVGF